MRFPNKLIICLVDQKTGLPLKIDRIMIRIHLFAEQKNDYYLGPYFSDLNGQYLLTSTQLENSVNSILDTGFMDYADYHTCKDIFEIEILPSDNLLSKVKNSNNCKVKPVKKMIALNNSDQKIEVELFTMTIN